jgi:uncharacterized protein (DUF433 family)
MFDRITFDPDVMGGRACIRGMRIPVSVIVGQIAHGADFDEILDGYPDLVREDVEQAVQFAASLTDEPRSDVHAANRSNGNRNGSEAVQQFRDLAQQWKDATEYCSSTTEISMHPAYQRIIGMGERALPLIVEELRHEPDHWFWALKAITGNDPVAPSDRGDLQLMTQAWLNWAGQHGY